MKFKFSRASDKLGDTPVIIEIDTLDDLKTVQEMLIAGECAKRGLEDRTQLINETSFDYDLCIDFNNKTIVLRDYWME